MLRTLTDLENQILDFAEKHPLPLREGDRSRIRAEFGWTPAAFAQRLHRLMDDAAAERARPMLIHRLRRLRADAMRARRAS